MTQGKILRLKTPVSVADASFLNVLDEGVFPVMPISLLMLIKGETLRDKSSSRKA